MDSRKNKQLELLEKARRYLPGATLGNIRFDSEHALVATKGKGSKVWDAAGNEYIDYVMGSGPMILGHAHPSVTAAVIEAVQDGSHFFVTNESAILLAEELVNAVPCAEKVRFTTSGTDANFQAMRIARAFRKRDKILKFEGGFHGTSDYAMMSVAPTTIKEFPQPIPSTAGIPEYVQKTMMSAPFNDLETTTAIVDKYHNELAAVIVEPLQRIIPPTPDFLKGLRDVTDYHQIPLIFDEVVTGFRLAYGGAQEKYGVVPDLAALGKIIGGGYPLAAVCGREEIMDAYEPKYEGTKSYVNQVGTLNGMPIACRAGLATLSELRKDGTYQRVNKIGKKLRESLDRLLREAGIPGQTYGDNSLFDVYFTDKPIINYRSTKSADTKLLNKFNTLLLNQSILKGLPQKIYPSTAHTDEDIKKTIRAFEVAVNHLRG